MDKNRKFMKNKRHTGVIILIASLLLAITFMDTWMIFTQMRQQIWDSGIYQLETISKELESTVNAAKNQTMELAIAAREYTEDKEALRNFILKKKEELLSDESGAFNVYIAGKDYVFIPDFVMPQDYVATERVWYTGAIRSGGKAYVSPPYQDAMTKEICYTVSVMLGDGHSVLGIDYTMENIQEHILQMYQKGSHNAVIVTDEGIIAGCSDQNMIGKKLVRELPDYAGIWSLSKNTEEVATARIRTDFLYENLFAAGSGNGWYMIVSENDWEMFQNSYIQLAVTVLLSLALFAIIILLYLLAVNNSKKAEDALASKEEFLNNITAELKQPLSRILEASSEEVTDNAKDLGVKMMRIHTAGEKLSEMIGQIMSYSSLVRYEEAKNSFSQEAKKSGRKREMNRRIRTRIVLFMLLVMLLIIFVIVNVTWRWGDLFMQRKAESYEYQLSEWINTQKSILDMFVSEISTNPGMLEDYEETVSYLNRITGQYSEISVTYMTNPTFEHTVYMNNGWEPDDDWHVEERQWYIDTLAAEEGWSVSAPYYDEQTGGYCVTISERVYDESTGAFLGIFGIDFFMDKLVEILGDSYCDEGYAFLVDIDGDIINHPYGMYQMSLESKTNITSTAYGEVKADGKSTQLVRDYDGRLRIVTAARHKDSKFVVYAVADVFVIYGKVLIYGLLCLFTYGFCVVLLYYLLTDQIRWQDENNRKMKEAIDAAVAAGKAKSQFLAQMSHEIRTPINAVLGMNEMILREAKEGEILEYAADIQSAGRNLLSIINSILDFSKLEDGKMEIIPVRYELAGMIHNLENSISERAKAKGLEFDLEIDETLPAELVGDDVRITQVIMNLLTNAVKYTDKGKVVLSVQKEETRGNTVVLAIKVSDTGIGIRQEDMHKLFESFERLEKKRNRHIEGTGLGMAIVTRLLHMMDSELQVDSVYGSGSVFSFRLQQGISGEELLGDYSKRPANQHVIAKGGKHLFAPLAKILVVDDNEMNLKVIAHLMKRNGFIPDLATSGEQAINCIRNRSYHIVFLDHMMPGMDGIETLNGMREQKLLNRKTKVIALTANAVSGAREMYLNAGFDDYLSKPVEVDKLEEKLADYLPAEYVKWKEDRAEEKPYEQEESVHYDKEDEILEFAPFESGQEETPADNDETILEQMEKQGFDVRSALTYCGMDAELYMDIAGEFVTAYKEKQRELDVAYLSKDWHSFEVAVHALKSTSKTIGAGKLSDEAKQFEKAAKNQDREWIEQNYQEFAKRYERNVEKISYILSGSK
ncbi:MAG: response regulator [Lachnospiraceae bacterium]|nr:response regulator [Lachnospiraceae bacterium]